MTGWWVLASGTSDSYPVWVGRFAALQLEILLKVGSMLVGVDQEGVANLHLLLLVFIRGV